MDKELYDLLDDMTAEELMPAEELLEEMAENTSLPEDTGSRIRTSVLRKAGFEMKNTIRMNKRNDNRSITDTAELNTVRRGHHIVAACAALMIVAAAGAVVFGSRLNALTPGSEVTEITETAESVGNTESADTSDTAQETDTSKPEGSSEPDIIVGESTVIPDVKGMSAEEAEKTLSDAGFVPVIKEGYFGEPSGKAVYTLPNAGQKLEKGFEVECRISLGEKDCEFLVSSVYGKRENEAVQLIEEAGLVPERVEVFSGFVPEGSVCDYLNGSRYDTMMEPGSTVKYYVSGSSGTTADIPDLHKVVYEDDDIIITADKLLYDGNYFIMHLNEETKDGRPISAFHEKWDVLLSCNGEEGIVVGTEHHLSDAAASGAFLAWAGDFTENGSELALDVVAREDGETPKSNCRMSFTIEPNLPSKTLTSEDGHKLTLSPMGITWTKDMNANAVFEDPIEASLDPCSNMYLITKDGKRIKLIDYYLSEKFGMCPDEKGAICFYAYRDIDDIAAVEQCGIIYR